MTRTADDVAEASLDDNKRAGNGPDTNEGHGGLGVSGTTGRAGLTTVARVAPTGKRAMRMEAMCIGEGADG